MKCLSNTSGPHPSELDPSELDPSELDPSELGRSDRRCESNSVAAYRRATCV